MGNFEKLSVLVIVVIIVMILVVALYTWQDNGDTSTQLDNQANKEKAVIDLPVEVWPEPPIQEPMPGPNPLFEPVVEPLPVDDPFPSPEPDPEPTPAPVPVGGEDVSVTAQWSYQIKSGDTLSQFTQRELGTIKRQGEVKKLNPDIDWLRIRPGQLIQMPARGKTIEGASHPGGMTPGSTPPSPGSGGTIAIGEYYDSKPGDTVQSIALKAYKSVERWPDLWSRNLSAIPSIDSPIKPGTRIFIPK